MVVVKTEVGDSGREYLDSDGVGENEGDSGETGAIEEWFVSW